MGIAILILVIVLLGLIDEPRQQRGKGNNMAKYTPEQLLTRAGHRHPDDILNALKQEYKLVPLPSDDAGDFGPTSTRRRTSSPEA